METRVLVISDLHLGGTPATDGKPAFQMCTKKGRDALVRFLEWATGLIAPSRDVHLVVAGDIVDFLAEERPKGFEAFTNDDRRAKEKLELILNETRPFWVALARFVEKRGALTLLLGNHDIELSLPGARRLLLETVGPGRVEFLYDNQAFTLGPVLVEHGNRYDAWNAVPHDDLRRVRSLLSRGEPATFDPLPGSHMVADIVNPTKRELSFVDLLKPEDAALLPFLALLAPNRFNLAVTTLKNRVRSLRVRYDADQQPVDPNYIGAQKARAAATDGTGSADDDRLLELAAEAAAGGDPNMTASGVLSFLDRWKKTVADAYRERQLDLLLKTLRAYRGSSAQAFDLAYEKKEYLAGATESAARGFQVVVYGHTHLPKKVALRGRKTSAGRIVDTEATYLNSGTWADLMAVPLDILGSDGEQISSAARERLRTFADDLAKNKVDRWRRLLPTFVDVTLDGDRVLAADVCLLGTKDDSVPVTSEMIREHLQGDGR